MKKLAKNQIEKIEPVIDKLKVVNKNGFELRKLAKAYFKDAKYFFDKRDYLRAFEAIVIVWAYIDAGLHLKVFEIPEKFKNLFTV